MAKKSDWIVYVEIYNSSIFLDDVLTIRKLTKKKVEEGPVGKEPYLSFMQWRFSDLKEAGELLTKIADAAKNLEECRVTYLCVRKDLA